MIPQLLRIFFSLTLAAASALAAAAPTLRVLTYNLHHGEGTDQKLDLPRLARVIADAKPDLVALQEVDQKTQRTKQVDQPAEYGRLTGLHAVFGRSMDYQGGGYGNAVLSRWPIEQHQVHPLPSSPGREPRSVLVVTTKPDGLPTLRFASTHLDHIRDATDRLAQATRLNELFAGANAAEPIVLAGDFNATPEKPEIKTLLGRWTDAAAGSAQPTVPAGTPRSRIDYILLRPAGAWKIVSATVLEEPVASDHRPVLVVLEWRGTRP
jgi:endonuclease/exonuclease/phosphatase family metal-dependent hydrolase